MKKIIFTFIVLYSSFLHVKAQDIIVKTNGEELKVTVASVLANEIEYKRADNISGPSYKIAKSEVVMIIYSNGTKEVITNTLTKPAVIASNNASNSQLKVEYGLVVLESVGSQIEVYCGNKEKSIYPVKLKTSFTTLNDILNKLGNEGWSIKSSNQFGYGGGYNGFVIYIERRITQ